MGFLGILEDHHLAHVPATVILNEEFSDSEPITAGLRHGTGKNSHIVLVPQPSEDPNDPLNWSQGKKLAAMLIVGFGGILYAATVSGLMNAALFVVAEDFKKTVGEIAVINGYQLLVAGATGPFVAAFSRKWGKRPVFLGSALLGVLGSIVGSATNSYKGLLAARIIQGGSTAAYESLIMAFIGDIYFVHERGLYMAGVQFILAAVSNFASVVCGPITTHLGWKYLFYLCVAILGLQTILLFLFVPESQYRRDARYNTDELVNDNLENLAQVEKRHEQSLVENVELEKSETVTSSRSHHHSRVKKTFVQELAVFTGTYSDDNLLQLIIAPFAVCTNLAVLWVVIVSGATTAFYVAQAIDIALIFAYPPYLLDAQALGYLFLGPFVGGCLGALVFGYCGDPIIRWCSRKNKGVYEPEYRLLMMAFGMLCGAGLMGFGALAQEHKSYYATATLHGIALFGIVPISIGTQGYALDAYRDMSSEIFVAGIVFKNFLFYGFTNFVNEWTLSAGPATVFYTFGGVAFALILTTPVVFIFGKRYRSHWARNNLLEKMHIKTHAEL
ncbi:hypothetical protein MBLNU459_g8110t1 [Dothideomycetes sp. NU459]